MIWLAGCSYQAVLADLSPERLAITRTQIAATCVSQQVEADACDLSRWPSASFDAVVCLGPFYHLPDQADQARTAGEVARHSPRAAWPLWSPRYALLRRTLALPDERQHLPDPRWLECLFQHGPFGFYQTCSFAIVGLFLMRMDLASLIF